MGVTWRVTWRLMNVKAAGKCPELSKFRELLEWTKLSTLQKLPVKKKIRH